MKETVVDSFCNIFELSGEEACLESCNYGHVKWRTNAESVDASDSILHQYQ